ncbi:hypothetical protein [cf. Phormidesmis sp. LEGE 11477]|uniref:hypothetical protein n=1 Tax=cf. Phormidesmis sp. LEGE 11477 TaxID=1828680 RepID=UPI0018805CEB|nr:hypothetical protein [cf. Phormidesmis sp. LEGE 11477]MBE9064235.1 hypothetical protein [cf. Phormidesmis sp. LEGE 11477]
MGCNATPQTDLAVTSTPITRRQPSTVKANTKATDTSPIVLTTDTGNNSAQAASPKTSASEPKQPTAANKLAPGKHCYGIDAENKIIDVVLNAGANGVTGSVSGYVCLIF